MKRKISDQIVVITGASSGIGRGTALELAAGGATIVLAARNGEELNAVRKECEDMGSRALAVPTDVSNSAEVLNLFSSAIAEFGRIDVWINAAGVAAIGKFTDVPLEDHLKVIQTDLAGTISGSFCALRHFVERRTGILINVASVIGKIPAPYYGSYAAAKYGIVGLNASLRQELDLQKLSDIHVCTVMPMAMDTPFFDSAANYTGKVAEPIPPLYDAGMVVDAIFNLIMKPEKEVIVGNMGKAMVAAHQIMPAMVEKTMAKQTHAAQIEKAEPGQITGGSVHEPSGPDEIHSSRLNQEK